jgi:hypothetical protein
VQAPWTVKAGLMGMRGRELALGLRMITPSLPLGSATSGGDVS